MYIACNYLKQFDTLKHTKDFVKHDPVLNKLGLVVRERKNPNTGVIAKKNRIILDNKESGVSSTASRTHKSNLPRATNAVSGALG